jgi:hypothetical protein
MASSLETGNLTLEAAGHEPGIRRFIRKFGPLEERTLIVDSEALLAWAGEAGESNDVMRIDGPLETGDTILGGFSKILDAGGEATATFIVGIEADAECIAAVSDADAAVGTTVGGTTAVAPVTVAEAEEFVDMTVATAALITEEEPGRWQITYYVLKGSEARSSYVPYVGDPNLAPQVPVTAEA